MNLDAAHVLITGGTDGIGLALARHLVAGGARVTVCGRSEDRLRAVRELEPSLCAVRCDVSERSQHAHLLAQARNAHGPIDVLVNNAGVQHRMDFTIDEPRAIDEEVATNLLAPLVLTDAVLPELLRRPRAAIVNVTSILALSPKASAPVYSATKSALRAFSRGLRWQLEGTRVRVLEIVPPLVDTAMTRGRGRGKLSPETVARAIARGIASGSEQVYIGKARLVRVLLACAPWLLARLTRRM